MPHPMVRSEKDWNMGFAKCIPSEGSAGTGQGAEAGCAPTA